MSSGRRFVGILLVSALLGFAATLGEEYDVLKGNYLARFRNVPQS